MTKFKSLLAIGVTSLFVLTGCGGGDEVASTGGEAPANAPIKNVKLKMASAFPSSLPILGDGGLNWTEKVDTLSGGTLEIKFFEPNALVP